MLKLTEVYTLKVFPSVYHFKYIKQALLTYPYHCCAFKFPATHDPEEFSRYIAFKENMEKMYCNQNPTTEATYENREETGEFARKKRVLSQTDLPSITKNDLNWNEFGASDGPFAKGRHRKHKRYHNLANNIYKYTIPFKDIRQNRKQPIRLAKRRAEWGSIPKSSNNIGFQDYWLNASDTEEFFGNHLQLQTKKPHIQKGFPDNLFEGIFHGTTVSVISEVELQAFCGQLAKNYRDVECFPNPDAFNPCEDVMGNMLLRVIVWLVVITAVMGNMAVMVVLLSTGACSSVSKFLMCNLAFADFCMGCYLFMIAAMDLHSMGAYFNHAIDWQHGYGCSVAGFLTVFATELSIFTLTIISVERWYAITFAINLNKRLRLRKAMKIMTIGWIFSLTMAFLPLVGVNGFARTSICLPMKNQEIKDVIYLMVLLITNSIAFMFIFYCYVSMYMTVLRHQCSATANDMAVAKRMALLVTTDFVCWAPVAFFAVTAVSGYPLIDVTNSKILLVFFYPLNSCANPFLYAIFTTQYRRDFLGLLRRCDCFSRWTRSKKGPYSNCSVPPLQFLHYHRQWQQNNSCSSQVSTDNSMKVLRPSDLSSGQDVMSSSGWEDQESEDVISIWSSVRKHKNSTSSEDSGDQFCKNHSSCSTAYSTTAQKSSPHPVKHRFIQASMAIKVDLQTTHTTRM